MQQVISSGQDLVKSAYPALAKHHRDRGDDFVRPGKGRRREGANEPARRQLRGGGGGRSAATEERAFSLGCVFISDP
jgi:hypothetical protein